jgi:hypothetical protein
VELEGENETLWNWKVEMRYYGMEGENETLWNWKVKMRHCGTGRSK